MSSFTPRFDTAITAYFKDFSCKSILCPETEQIWELPQEALTFYQQLKTPPSKLVPWAQIRRMRAAVIGVDFFSRSLSNGHSLITCYDPQSIATLLPPEEWHTQRTADAFLRSSSAIDPQSSFFEQWARFSPTVPRPSLIQDPKNENSEWTNSCVNSKNEYYSYNEYSSQNCLYCEYGMSDANSCDLTGCDHAEWSYDSTLCYNVSHAFFSERCTESHHLTLCLNCVNCRDCFGSANLKNKQFYFLNEQLSEEEYKRRIAEIDLSDHQILQAWRKRIIQNIWDNAPRKAVTNRNVERATGDENIDSRDVIGVALTACQRTYLSFGNSEIQDSCSITSSIRSERCLYSQNLEQGYENKFSSYCTSCIDVEYCELLQNCEHCFGCIGLQNKKFCILNTQYSEEEYWNIVDELKTQMLKRGEYGEFFPYSSFFNAYNTSNGDIFFPLLQAEAEKIGARWFDFHAYQIHQQETQHLHIQELPEKLSEFTDAMLSSFFRCEKSGRLYRIVKPELAWHRQFNVALPRLHPTIRRKQRDLEMYPVEFTWTECATCHKHITTRVPLSRGYTLLCETCFENQLLEA